MATVGKSSKFIVLASSCALLAVAAPPALAKTHRALGGCGAAAGSAIHQYCEAIPSSTGGSAPRLGSPSVAKTLTRAIIRELNAGAAAQRKLLTLPGAPHKRHRKHAIRLASVTAPTTGVWSLPLVLILVLAAIALALAAGAAERWRRRRAQ
jgi:hypothetical protein